MRILAPALLLLMASCGRGGPASNDIPAPGNDMGRQAEQGPAGPTVVIAATGPGNCAASWDGQPATAAQVTERSRALLEQAIAAAGGARNLTEEAVPVAIVEAPADMNMACAETILFALQRSGMVSVRLRPAGGQAVLMDFPLNTDLPPPPIPMVLGLGAGGQATWNGAPLDDAGLAAQLGRIGGTEAPDPMEGPPPPGGLELRVSREATVGQLHALLLKTGRYHVRPSVYLPSAEAGPSGAQVAAPPPPPAPPRP